MYHVWQSHEGLIYIERERERERGRGGEGERGERESLACIKRDSKYMQSLSLLVKVLMMIGLVQS